MKEKNILTLELQTNTYSLFLVLCYGRENLKSMNHSWKTLRMMMKVHFKYHCIWELQTRISGSSLGQDCSKLSALMGFTICYGSHCHIITASAVAGREGM